MLLSDLQYKDIVNLKDGRKIGSIIDVVIDRNGTIQKLAVQKKRFLFFSGQAINIRWNQIDKIGKDVILVNIS